MIELASETKTAREQTEAAPLVIVEHLAKSYKDVRALDDLSFEVRRGEVFGLLGPNGAGKTTTVEIIETLRSPDRGRVRVCGYDPAIDQDEIKKRIGVALQATALPDRIKPREALHLFASFYPQRADADELLALVSLEEKANASFNSLSGGQQKRLAVALALVNDPELVLLDEPTAGLDPQSRRELHSLIERLRELGKTVILTTHYIEEAERLCDRVAIIDHGKIIALDAPARLVSRSRGLSRIEFTTSAPLPASILREISFLDSIQEKESGFALMTSNAPQSVVELIHLLEAHRAELIDLHITRPTLEDVFIELTGREIRD
ncbi:MAG: ABC transporter ATP-binding protein [Acidobacteriota bacterium]